MSITIDVGTAGTPAIASPTFTFAHTVGTGLTDRFLRVSVGWTEVAITPTISVSSVTYNGVTMTQVPSSLINIAIGDGLTSRGLVQYGLINPATGTNNVVITMSANGARVYPGADSWSGVHQTTAYGTATTANAADTSPTINVSSDATEIAVSSAIIIGTLSCNDTQAWNTGSVSNADAGGSYKVGSTTATLSWTGALGSPYNWLMSAISLKPIDVLFAQSWL